MKSSPNSQKVLVGGRASKIFVSVIIVGLLLLSRRFSYLYYQEKNKKGTMDIEGLLTEVGKLIELPQGEIPTIATVTDKTKLQNQPILKRAENGDKVIIYIKAQRAILYRPSTGKIIDVVPVNTPSQEPTTSKPVTPVPVTPSLTPVLKAGSIRAVLLNGTSVASLTYEVEPVLLEKVPEIKVVGRDKAAKDTYDETIIIDVSKKFSSSLDEIAQAIGGTVTVLPEDEIVPDNTDILIIFGKDAP